MLRFILAGIGLAFLGHIFQEEKGPNNKINDNWNYEESQKEKEAEQIFNQRKYDSICSFTNKISYDLTNNLKFCKEEIVYQFNNYKSELNIFSENILNIENSEKIFFNRLNQTLDKLSDEMKKLEVNHLNILLVGQSGVGKSFLINSILKLNFRKKAESKIVKPTTKSFKIYESNKIPNIRLIDSRGIEKGNYNIDSLVKEITSYIENQELKGNPDNFIHCIWYCITGSRFEDIEEEALSKLSSIYDDSKLPIIVVYTQAINPAFYNAINQEINKIKKGVEFIPVVAKDISLNQGILIKSKNIDLLLNKSLDKSTKAVYSSVFSSLRKIVKKEINTQIDNKTNLTINNLTDFFSFKENITLEEYVKSIIELDEEDIYNKMFEILLFEDEMKQELKEESKQIIKKLINYLHNKNQKIFQKCFDDFANNYLNELVDNLMDIQTQVNREKRGYLKNYKNRRELREEANSFINNQLFQKVKYIGILNYKQIIPLKIADLLSEKSKNIFELIITNNSTKNILNKKLQEQFKKLSFIEKHSIFNGNSILVIMIMTAFIFMFIKY